VTMPVQTGPMIANTPVPPAVPMNPAVKPPTVPVPAPSAPMVSASGFKVPTPAPTVPSLAAVDLNKIKAQGLLVEARQLQKAGNLVAARQKAVESQRCNALFGPDEDRPEMALLQLASGCEARITGLLNQADECMRTGRADAFPNAQESLTQAKSLAVSFGLDAHLIVTKL